jgi:hypothetical protein
MSALEFPGVPDGNFPVDCASPHAEVLDTRTMEVWQSCLPITRADYEALELDAGYNRVGLGSGVMDRHYFRRSPGADRDGPVRLREFGGRKYLHCARPPQGGPSFPAGRSGPALLLVDKHHTLIYEAGRSLNVLRTAEGRELVHVIRGDPDPDSLVLPKDWELRSLTTQSALVVHLPAPTTAFFFSNGASYQGPVVFQAS